MSINSKKNLWAGHSITQHWLINSLGVVSLILVVVEIVLVIIVRNYYYSSARQYVTSKMNVVTAAVMNSSDDTTNYNSEIRNLVESYGDKDKIELMAITADGGVDVTSSGFSPPEGDNMSDYKEAKGSASGVSSQIYDLSTGEKVVAVTAVISPKGCEYEALRMLSSMKNVDHQILVITLLITVVVVVIILLVMLSGMLLLMPSKSAAEFSFPVLRFSLMCTAPTAITIAAAAAVIAVKMLFLTFACLTFVLL